MKHPRTWYVVADGGRARIVRKRNGEHAFDTHRELVSAEIHSHTHELGTDRRARVAQLQKDLTKVPDAELKEHFAAISRA